MRAVSLQPGPGPKTAQFQWIITEVDDISKKGVDTQVTKKDYESITSSVQNPRCSEPGWACSKRSRTRRERESGEVWKFGKQPACPTAGITDTVSFCSVPEPRGGQEDSGRVVGARGAASDLPYIGDRDRGWRNQNRSCFNSGLISWAS